MSFRRSVIISELWRLKSEDVRKFCEILAFFWKNDPLRENFQNSDPKVFVATPIYVLCADFMKFGRREIGEIVRCLPDKKQTSPRTPALATARIAPNLLGPAPDNALRVLQTSSKSVLFRRSYSRTREHRQHAL